MSRWGTIQAEFECGDGAMSSAEAVSADVPRGSEDGADIYELDGVVRVEGRLRDVLDATTSPAVLAWFTKHAEWCEKAWLMWELDGGPRYRYEWNDGELRKLRGVLDG